MADIGRLAFSLAGVVIGAFFPPLGASIGLAIGTGLGYLIFPPEGKNIEGPRLDDLKVTFSSYGKPIPRIYGKMETGGNVVWSPGLVEHREEEEVGGYWGIGGTTVVTFTYTASFRINYCVGVADAILRNWADGKLLVDITGFSTLADIDTFGEIIAWYFIETGAFGAEVDSAAAGRQAIRNYLGTTTQFPGPAEQADKGVANVSAYRGTVGQEWEDLPLEDYGNRIPQISAEIAMAATEDYPSDTLTGLTSAAPFMEWLPDKAGFLIEESTIINNLNQTVVTSVANSTTYPNFPSVDSSGNFYRLVDTGLGYRIDKFSGKTLQRIEAGKALKEPLPPNAALGSIHPFSYGRIFNGSILLLTRTTADLETVVIDVNALQSPTGGVINLFDLPAFIASSSAMCPNGANGLWLMYNSGANTVLMLLSAPFGHLVESYTIGGFNNTYIAYEPITHSVVLGKMGTGTGHLLRFDITTKAIVAQLENLTLAAGVSNTSEFWNGVTAGALYLDISSSGKFTRFNVIDMVEGRTWDPVADYGFGLLEHGMYDPIHHAMIMKDGSTTLHWLYLDRWSGDNITVRSIVEDVSSVVDYTAGTDIDATELVDTLPGYIIRSRMTARKALEPLATAFNFRSVESDFKIKFPKRGGASVGNIPQIDLGATAGEVPTTQPWNKTRMPEDQLFETAIIEYVDPTFDNNLNTQQAKRAKEAIDVGGSLVFNFPGALGNNQAAQIIERILFQAWAGRTTIATSVPLKHILKDPGDVVTITKDNKTVQVELNTVKLGANSILKIEGTIDDSAVHVSGASGIGAEGDEGQVISIKGPTEFFVLDIPLLHDAQDDPGLYTGAGSFSGFTWPGATLFKGLTTVSIFPFAGVNSARNIDYGFATNALTTHSSNIWDRTNSLTINLASGTLSSDTEANVLNGTNVLVAGDEIIQFATAVLNADGTYTVSTLLRGRRGTEWATGTHVAEEDVIIISTLTLLRIDVDLSDHLSTFYYKAITLGSPEFSSKTIQQVLNFRGQMPYAPSHVAGTIAADEWTFTLIRRTRLGGAWKDAFDAPIGELSESYEWDVMSGSTVVRTLTSVTGTVVYTSANQVDDFSGNQTTVELNVYQISPTVARGFVTNVTLVGG